MGKRGKEKRGKDLKNVCIPEIVEIVIRLVALSSLKGKFVLVLFGQGIMPKSCTLHDYCEDNCHNVSTVVTVLLTCSETRFHCYVYFFLYNKRTANFLFWDAGVRERGPHPGVTRV